MAQPDFEAVLRAAARLQQLVPDAVLVGGTAASVHAGHRVSFDDDHVLADLRERFDALLSDLESTEGWQTARVKRPVLVLGRLDGVETGLRQLIRTRPLEVEERLVGTGLSVRVPTLEEMLRVKAWLVVTRNATRDYLDTVALAGRVGGGAGRQLARLDRYYEAPGTTDRVPVATQLVRQLAEPRPHDMDRVELRRYRRLVPELQDWEAVVDRCRDLAASVATGHEGSDDVPSS